MVTKCFVKALCGVKVTGLKLHELKSSHAKGCCGPGRVQSPSDFDELDAIE